MNVSNVGSRNLYSQNDFLPTSIYSISYDSKRLLIYPFINFILFLKKIYCVQILCHSKITNELPIESISGDLFLKLNKPDFSSFSNYDKII